jgi:hypothetical protein
VSALIAYHLKIDPDKLSDLEFSKKWQELKFAWEFENKRANAKADEKIEL